jgi:ABC-type Fe3+/spermidine/putrescine transport system ATPase subunit
MTASRKDAAAPVRVAGIGKHFGKQAVLADVTLDFVAGGFNTLLGPSGCGKTTLLRTIAGFVAPDTGSVFLRGTDVTDVPPWRRRIGFVFQSYALWPHMSVLENVGYGLKLRRIGGDAAAERVRAMLATLGLAGAGERYPAQLSGGQQQRVALARALVLEPDVLLLDEPLSNLDARLRAEMRLELRRLQREVGITTIYVTHDQEEALELSDVIAVLREGRVLQVGAPEEVYRRPRSTAVARFLGASNLLEGEAQADGCLVTAGKRLPLALPSALAGRTLRVALRAEDITVAPATDATACTATVVDRVYLGHGFRLTLRLGEELSLVAYTAQPFAVGDSVGLEPGNAAVMAD